MLLNWNLYKRGRTRAEWSVTPPELDGTDALPVVVPNYYLQDLVKYLLYLLMVL